MEQKDGHSGESSAEGTHVEKEAVIGDDDPSMLIRTEERQGSLPGNVRVEGARTTDIPIHPKDIRHRLIVPIAGLDGVSIQSLAYARSISRHVTAVHVAVDIDDANKVGAAWGEWQKHLTDEEETHLVVIESPYRSLARPLLAYIDTVHELYPDDTLTVILPEFVVTHWWEHILHNQTALQLKAALLFRPGIVVTNIPQHLPDHA